MRYQGTTTWVEDRLGHTTGYASNERQDIVAVRDPLGHITHTPFDANGHPKGSTDALGRSSHSVFDARGNLTHLIDAAGHSTRIAYNAQDLPIELTDALGGVWTRAYDARGNLITSTDPLGHSTQYEVDERGQVTAITDALGKRKTLQWDALGQLSAYTDCSGQTSRFSYDPLGHLSRTTNALGQTTHYQHDALGRLQQLRDPSGAVHRYQWSGEGRLLAYTDPLGQTTRWRYNAAGELLQRTDALGQHLHYHHDAAGRLVHLLNENNQATHFRYDAADRLTDEIGFDGRHQRYIYNAAAELTHLIERGGSDCGPGQITHFERDALGRLTAKRHGSGNGGNNNNSNSNNTSSPESNPDATYRYDALGRLSEAANALATVQFAYDPLGQLLKEEQHIRLPGQAGSTHRFTHGYDPLGNRIATQLPGHNGQAGQTLQHLFYGSGHLHQVRLAGPEGTQVISDFERDALHRETTRTQGALLSQFAYDPAGRLSGQRVLGGPRGPSSASGSQPWAGLSAQERTGIKSFEDLRRLPGLIERHYAYDPSGQLRQIVDKTRGATGYGYDAIGRITGSHIGQGTASSTQEPFHWDAASNPVPAPEPGLRIQPVAGNRLHVWQDTRYTYDEHGNLVHRVQGKRDSAAQTDSRFFWDAAHQLRSAEVTRGAGEHATTQRFHYGYDALGRRITKQDAFGTTLYLWDGDQMVLERRGGNETHTVYLPLSFVPLAQIHNGQVHHLHTDHLGTPLEATNEQGQITWRVTYKTWGNVLLQEEEQITQNLRFQGQYFDQETGLHYNRFRYYDPGPGRFVSQDPIGLAGGVNLFQYAPNSTGWVDPLGLAKRGPKTNGCGPHNEMIAEWGKEVEAAGGTILAGGGALPETKIPTVGGIKGGRRPDIIYTEASGGKIYGNVGKNDAQGNPIKREREAMDDLKNKTQGNDKPDDMQFRSYNCRCKKTPPITQCN